MGHHRLAGALAAAFLACAGLAAVPASPASAARRTTPPAWTVPTPLSPNTTNYNSPLATSCGSPTSCKAVGGSVSENGLEQTLIESWNGTIWSVSPSPNYGTGTISNTLTGVSCVSATFCEAVGYYVSATNAIQTLVETWNGTTWTLTASPDHGTTTNVLSGVSCVSPTSCQAVGYYASPSSVIQTLIESWNGSIWSVAASPNNGPGNNSLTAVSCTSTTVCRAVGWSTLGSGIGQTLVESLSGTTWTVSPSANNGTGTNVLQGVACASASSCQAVGYDISVTGVIQTLGESWNGSSWAVTSTANNGTGSNALYDVSCPAPTICEAVGYDLSAGGVIQTLAESWNGSAWSIPSTPDNGTSTNALYGVACVSTNSCLAAGSYTNTSGIIQTLVESWNGSAWSLSSTPGGALSDSLNAVSCESSGFCEAVGSYQNASGAQQTLAESWYGGNNWSIIPTPDVGTRSNTLSAVTCLSISFCEAVGSSLNSSGVQQTLVESWNGSVWTIVPSPSTGTGANTLTGVSCFTTSFCQAVGYSVNSSGIQQTLAEVWNGATWTISPTLNSGTFNNSLASVSCVSNTLCQAVGSYLKFGKVSRPLVEAWNGSTWSITPAVPNFGAFNNVLNGVSCVSTTSCHAVGYFLTSTGVKQTMVMSWSGKAWFVTHGPNAGTGNNELLGLTCIGTTFCQAVGDAASPSGTAQALVETFNGTAWTVAFTLSTGSNSSTLGGVACLSTTSCKAVGQYALGTLLQTLVASYG